MLTIKEIMKVSEKYIHLEEFVDRTAETSQFQALITKRHEERDIHKRIIAFFGQPGIGKTVLLDRLEFECDRMNVPHSRINFEAGIFNSPIEILREMVWELDPKGFKKWAQLLEKWFSSEPTELNINVQGGEAGGVNFAGENISNVNLSAGGDLVAGSKVEVKGNTINVSTRAANDPKGAQVALTESFVEELREFVKEKPAILLFEGLDHEYCSSEIRSWVYGLLDRIRLVEGFGVLPVVTYFTPPKFEDTPRLRSATYRAELKPLGLEHVVEYFRTRGIPKNIIAEAAKSCFEETQGVPARVFEYAENLVYDLVEAETIVEDVVTHVQETLEQPRDIETPSQQTQEQERPIESVAVVEASTSVVESVEAAAESVPVEVKVEELAPVEQQQEDVEAPPVIETPAAPETVVIEPPAPVDESPVAVVVEMEKTDEGTVSEAEAVSPVQEEAKVISESESKTEETSQLVAEVESQVVEPPVVPELVPEPVKEAKVVSKLEEAPPQETPAVAVQPVQPEAKESPQQAQQTTEEMNKSEEAFRRSQERLKQMKSEGRSSTGNMVESILTRQSTDVVDAARRCSVLRWFTADLIAIVMDEQVTPERAGEILEVMSGWKFVQNFGYGTRAYRKEVQQYLQTQLQKESPSVYAEIHKRAQVYFERKLDSVDLSDEMIWVNLQPDQGAALRENLYYLLHVDVTRGFELLRHLFQSAQRLFMHGEAAILLKFANEVDKTTLGENYKDQLSYYEASLEFAEGGANMAESKLRELMVKPLENELKAQVLGQLGVIANTAKRYDEAIKFFEQAQKIWKDLKREREQAVISNNLGNVYMRKDDLNRAERAFNAALDGLKKAEAATQQGSTSTLGKLGSLFTGSKVTGAPADRALTLNNLGNVYRKREKLSKALEYYQQSLDLKGSIGDQFGAATTYSNIGTVYQLMAQESSGKKQAGYLQQAAENYLRSLETYQTFGARSEQGRLMFKLAYFYFQTGDKTKAREYLPNALEIFQNLEMPELENASKLATLLG